MIAHWDEVETFRRDRGFLSAEWADLGSAAGTVTVGVRRIRLRPGEIPTPPHMHGNEEEIFYVLEGSGLSWQDGRTYAIAAGDCLVHRIAEEAHTLRAGPGGLEVLAFGMRRPAGYNRYLPRARAAWLWPAWVTVTDVDDEHPWQRENAAGPLEFPEPEGDRPPTMVNVQDVRVDRRDGDTVGGEWRNLGRAAGSELTGLKHVRVAPGKLSAPPHCHSAEEEIFVVLDGDGVLELVPRPHERDGGVRTERREVRRGHVVSRRPATRIAHAFRAGDAGLTLLAYGTRDRNDIAYYPRSNKIFFRGAGVIARLEHVDYWDGED